MINNDKQIKAKKNILYSICTCGLSKKIPFCDNTHRQIKNISDIEFKSVKISCSKDNILSLKCKTWDKHEK